MPHHSTIRRSAVFELVEATNLSALLQPVQVELAYDIGDPLAVQAAFRCGRASWLNWTFSRDLLTLGIATAVGEGDICVRPTDEQSVEFELRSPNGHARLTAALSTLQDFLSETYELVPAGAEGD